MSTLLQLVQRLWVESGRLGAGPTTVVNALGDQARAVNRIRDAWRELQQEPRNWRWMRESVTATLTVDDGQYTTTDLGIQADFDSFWPDGMHYAPEVLDASDNVLARLDWLPYDEFRHGYMAVQSSGTPMVWSVAPGGDLLLAPAPSEAGMQIRIDYKHAIQELTLDADTPDMPAKHHLLLVWKALEQFGFADENAAEKLRATMNLKREHALLLDSQGESPTLDDCEPLA